MITEPHTLARLRSRYQDDSAQLRQSFERNGDGSAVIRRRSQIVGTLLRQLWEPGAAFRLSERHRAGGDRRIWPPRALSLLRRGCAVSLRQRKGGAGLQGPDPRLHAGDVGHRPPRQSRHANAEGNRKGSPGQSRIHRLPAGPALPDWQPRTVCEVRTGDSAGGYSARVGHRGAEPGGDGARTARQIRQHDFPCRAQRQRVPGRFARLSPGAVADAAEYHPGKQGMAALGCRRFLRNAR
jgi:hypothetical protein